MYYPPIAKLIIGVLTLLRAGRVHVVVYFEPPSAPGSLSLFEHRRARANWPMRPRMALQRGTIVCRSPSPLSLISIYLEDDRSRELFRLDDGPAIFRSFSTAAAFSGTCQPLVRPCRWVFGKKQVGMLRGGSVCTMRPME